MKKKNVYSVLFVFAMLFIIVGVGGSGIKDAMSGAVDMFMAKTVGDKENYNAAKQSVEASANERLRYHNLLIDVNSERAYLLGTRVVIKDDATVVRADSGSLAEPVYWLDEDSIDEVVQCIQGLKDVTEENGAKFLYCAVPGKEYYEQLPQNVANYAKPNHDRFLNELRKADVPVLDFVEVFSEEQLSSLQIYYSTDHHWRAQSGFLASATICQRLSSLYGFEFDEAYTDLSNYSVTTYEDWFLGSKGKKVGKFFSKGGADDFELIIPIFETSLVEEHKIPSRQGNFEETVLFLEHMKKDYYSEIPYMSYCGGDFRYQVITNCLNPEGKKILLIKDSFACVVAPFLSLETKELHICDLRDFDYIGGTRVNISEFIGKIKPDYVILLYQGVDSIETSHGKYSFFSRE